MPDSRLTNPQQDSMERTGMELIQTMMVEELSEHQRVALTAVAIRGMPLEEAANLLGTNRNALYKTIHDARLKLKARMRREGLSLADIAS